MANSFSLVAPRGVTTAVVIVKNGKEHEVKGEVLIVTREDGEIIVYPLYDLGDITLKVNWNS